MSEYDASTYGERIADVYDEWHATLGKRSRWPRSSPAWRRDGPAHELGIGTGRVALRLRERGIEVHGVDASPAMVERLRGKPGGADIPVSIGDFADVPGDGRFALVYAVFKRFFDAALAGRSGAVLGLRALLRLDEAVEEEREHREEDDRLLGRHRDAGDLLVGQR
jgi:SAM-dependent methyltransferase